jgi:hypothetical protein
MRTLLITIFTCAFAFTASAADNPFVGSWELNLAESKRDPNMTKIQKQTIVYSTEGSGLKALVTIDGKPSGAPTIYDGKEHDRTSTTVGEYTKSKATAHSNSLETVLTKDARVVRTRKNTLSPDGRTMTVVTEGTAANGAKIHNVDVFERQ